MGKGGKNKEGSSGKTTSSVYVVVDYPWGMKVGAQRSQVCADNVGFWFRSMFPSDILPDTVYTKSTLDAIIVKLPKRVDVIPFLGKHTWREFLTHCDPAKHNHVSYISKYNYKMHGKPESSQWQVYLPTTNQPPQSPFRKPYPQPTWVLNSGIHHPLHLRLPNPSIPILVTPALEVGESSVSSTHLLTGNLELETKKECNKVIENSLAISSDVVSSVDNAEPTSQRPFIEKHDPYEEDDEAAQFLQTAIPLKQEPDVDQKPFWVKQEEVAPQLGDYQASEELLAVLATLPEHQLSQQVSHPQRIKIEAQDVSTVTDTYEPSSDLLASLGSLPIHQLKPAVRSPTIKHELEDDADLLFATYTNTTQAQAQVTNFNRYAKKIKLER